MSNSNSTKPGLTASASFLSLTFTFGRLAVTVTPSKTATLAPTESASRFDVRFLQETTGHHMMPVDMASQCVQKAINAEQICNRFAKTLLKASYQKVFK